ncbi:MAG TPA: hypothetical protein VF062_01925 [Candidatus Limnocylindrales bacterium]
MPDQTKPLLVLPTPADPTLLERLMAAVRGWHDESLRRGEIQCHAEELPGLGPVMVVRADSRAGGSDA